MTKKNNKKKPHDKFMGADRVTQTVDLIYYDGPIAQATVVRDKDGGPFRLQLDYLADEDFKDNDGYIGIRWTKQDLQHMITMLELTEGVFNERGKQQRDDERSEEDDLQGK